MWNDNPPSRPGRPTLPGPPNNPTQKMVPYEGYPEGRCASPAWCDGTPSDCGQCNFWVANTAL